MKRELNLDGAQCGTCDEILILSEHRDYRKGTKDERRKGGHLITQASSG